MKKAIKYIYRIKDVNTNLYYKRRIDKSKSEKTTLSNYHYKFNKNTPWGREYVSYLYFDEIGHFYPTLKGAERIVSEFTKCSRANRATEAGRVLNARFNFVVVKSKMKLTDIVEKNETENVSISSEDKSKISE